MFENILKYIFLIFKNHIKTLAKITFDKHVKAEKLLPPQSSVNYI